MRVLIATVQVPFISGGAEIHANGLKNALLENGHEAEIVAIPFKWYPPSSILDCMLACRLLDLSEVAGMKIDRVIGLKFPAYLVPHDNKVLWILHQHRQAYEQWGTTYDDLSQYPMGIDIRDAIRQADSQLLPEAKAIYSNSRNVTKRLSVHCGIDSTPLYHPPSSADLFYKGEAEDYLFFPSRLTTAKRQYLVLQALAKTKNPVKVRFAGVSDTPTYAQGLQEQASEHGIANRAEWLGYISEQEKIDLYAHCLAVVYPPFDEDYGYVTLEAMLASKPVITLADSGGPLEFVTSIENGIVAEAASAEGLAQAMDIVWENRNQAGRWGLAGRKRYDQLGISWSQVVEKLLS